MTQQKSVTDEQSELRSYCKPVDNRVNRLVTSPRYNALGVACLTLILAACGGKPSQMVLMSETIATTLADSSAELEQSDMRQAIDTASDFAGALRQAVQANEGYRSSLSIEQMMIARIGIAESGRFPQVTGNSTVGGIRERSDTQPDETTTGVAVGINLSQLVYDGGESVANVNRATAEALGARAERVLQGNGLALEAARAWIDVWQYEARLRLFHKRTSDMDMVVSQVERMAVNGMSDRLALESVLRQIVDIDLEETRLQAGLEQAKVRFARFFNQEPKNVPRPAELVSLAEARQLAAEWQQAPALQRAAAELILARSAVVSAQAAFKPRVLVQAGVTSPMQEGESTDTSLGFVLEYKFADGGRRQSQLESAEARAQAIEVGLSEAQRTFKMEMEASIQQLASLERSMPLVQQQIDLSNAEATTLQSQLATGQSDLRQLIGTKIENYRAEDRQISMRAEQLALQFAISSQTGALGQLIGLKHNLGD